MEYPLVSVILITYNRYHLLERTLLSLRQRCTYPNIQYIICDDASPIDVQEKIKKLPADIFLIAESNQGLGKNTNKGIIAAEGEYILQLQDDFEFIGDPNFIQKAIEVMTDYPDLALLRFYRGSESFNGCSKRKIKSGENIYVTDNKSSTHSTYSDTPHIKTKFLHDKIGLYKEKVSMCIMEVDFLARWNKQEELLSAFWGEKDLFVHTGAEDSYNPSQIRMKKINKLKENKLLLPFIDIYLFVRRTARKILNTLK